MCFGFSPPPRLSVSVLTGVDCTLYGCINQQTTVTRKDTHKSLILHRCTSWNSQRGPGEYAASPQTLSLGFKSSLLDYSASSSKVLGLPSLYSSSRLTHLPVAMGHTRILSWFTFLQSLGPILPYLMHLGSFGFVNRCSWWEYITVQPSQCPNFSKNNQKCYGGSHLFCP